MIKKILFFALAFLISFTPNMSVSFASTNTPSTNTIAQELLSYVNNLRSNKNLKTLTEDSSLDEIAQERAEEMSENNSLVLEENLENVLPSNLVSYSENVASTDSTDPSKEIFYKWSNNKNNESNMLNSNYNLTGIGYAVDNNNVVWVSEIFAQKNTPNSTNSTLTPSPTTSSNSSGASVNKNNNSSTNNTKDNSESELISQIQAALYNMNYLKSSNVTGIIDNITISTIKEFQRDVGVAQTGSVSQSTLTLLQSKEEEGFKKPGTTTSKTKQNKTKNKKSTHAGKKKTNNTNKKNNKEKTKTILTVLIIFISIMLVIIVFIIGQLFYNKDIKDKERKIPGNINIKKVDDSEWKK